MTHILFVGSSYIMTLFPKNFIALGGLGWTTDVWIASRHAKWLSLEEANGVLSLYIHFTWSRKSGINADSWSHVKTRPSNDYTYACSSSLMCLTHMDYRQQLYSVTQPTTILYTSCMHHHDHQLGGAIQKPENGSGTEQMIRRMKCRWFLHSAHAYVYKMYMQANSASNIANEMDTRLFTASPLINIMFFTHCSLQSVLLVTHSAHAPVAFPW